MDLTQIRYFLAVARELNFTRAAESCHVTQPALTRAVQRLEEELGGPLLLRERALTQLTPLGQAMLPLLQQTLDSAEAVRAGAAALMKGDAPAPLRLGMERGLPLRALTPLLGEVIAHVGQAALSLSEDSPESLTEALLHGALDVALLPEPHPLPDRLSRWPLWTQRLSVLLPEHHPLAARDALTFADLMGEPVLPPASAAAGAAMVAAGFTRSPGGHSAGAAPAGQEVLVALGLGVALVPEGPAPGAGCVARPLEGAATPVVLAVPAGRPMNRAVSAFVKLARARRWEMETA
jgi:DNA-binding transcriptional LysR family regulator